MARQLPHEQIAVPRRKQAAGIERDAGWRDIGSPEIDGLLHAFLHRLIVVNRLSIVLVAVPNNRKPVVSALLDDVDLVTAARPVLAGPELPGARVNRDALHIPESEREDFR